MVQFISVSLLWVWEIKLIREGSVLFPNPKLG